MTGSRFSLALAWLSDCLNPSLLILFVVVVGATLMRVKVHVTLNFLNIPMSSPGLWHPSSNGICAGKETGRCCPSFFYHLSTRFFLPSRGYLPIIFYILAKRREVLSVMLILIDWMAQVSGLQLMDSGSYSTRVTRIIICRN